MSQPKKNTLGTSEATLSHAISRRRVMPIVVRDLGRPRLITIAAKDLHTLSIDERYQRSRITDECHRIVHALKAGGDVPDPITVAERTDGTRWIVDGQQRWWAHFDCQESLQALIYSVTDFETECNLFSVLNERVAVNAETIVKAHRGQTATLIREAADKMGSPYFGHVNFGNKTAAYPATVLSRGMLAAAAGILPAGGIKQVLARCDFALQDTKAQERVQAYMRLVPLVFPPQTRLKMLPAIGVATVAYRRWRDEIEFPGPKVYERLKRLNWDVLVPNHQFRQLAVLEQEIEKRWPKTA